MRTRNRRAVGIHRAIARPLGIAARRLAIPVLGAGLASGEAAAEPRSLEAYVVGVQGKELIVNLPPDSGVSVGSVMQVWRPLSLRHPVTGKRIQDRYHYGYLKVSQVMRLSAMTRAKGKLSRKPALGDIVVFELNDVGSSESGEEQPAPRSEAEEIEQLLQSLTAAPPLQRARAYESYLARHPRSPLAQVIREEARLLRARHQSTATPSDAIAVERPPSAWLELPRRVYAERELEFVLQFAQPVAAAVLHLRARGQVGFQSIPLSHRGGQFYGVSIPKDAISAPQLDLFVEAVGADGKAQAAWGSADAPRKLRVVAPPKLREPLKHKNTLELTTDYSDYNRLRGNDRVWLTEGSLGLRFTDRSLRAVRSGFGVYRAVGGTLLELDTLSLPDRVVKLTYGYIEAELGMTDNLSFIGRGLLGLGELGLRDGAQLHLRLGNDLRTNLTLGGELLGGIGLRGIVDFQLSPSGRLPVTLRSEVTNQPVGSGGAPVSGGELGIRAIAGVGYRLHSDFLIGVRASYQGRSIQRSGPGLGGKVSYSW